MSSNMISDVRSIPLTALVFSQTPAQIERREHFNQEALKELGETIKAAGRPEQFVIVRPIGDDAERFEVADGERRCIAAKAVGLDAILCDVRPLTDEQVQDIQIITGLQKEGLHELVEAEGYETLSKRGLSVEEIADRVGKSKAYVYARMKLLALDPASRHAFYRGELNASTALLIARIPVASLQRKACGEITKSWNGEAMSTRDAAEHIHRNFMLRLADASFPTEDAKLLKNCGACGPCPKRTGNQPELFGDVKGDDICTDPTCFKAKTEAGSARKLEEGKASGQKILSGAEAKRIAEHGHVSNGYVSLDSTCYEDPKNRTYRQLIGKAVTPALLKMPKGGEVVEVVEKSAISKILKEKGAYRPPVSSASNANSAADKAAREKREREVAFSTAILKAIHRKGLKELVRADLETIAACAFYSGFGDSDEELFELFGWPEPGGNAHDRYARAFSGTVKSIPLSELNAVLLTLALTGLDNSPAAITAAAKRLKIDTDRIRKDLAAADSVKTPPPARKKK